jgi:Fe-Mn family superoxide dismutase
MFHAPRHISRRRAGGTALEVYTMPYTLPALPYAFDALEPHIDARTMEIHHGKHHQAYITNLNAAIEGTDLGNQSIESLVARINEVPENIRTAVRNNGGGHANHSLFWTIMGPNAGGQPSGPLAEAIHQQLGGFDSFKEAFTKAGLTRFGSGWAWLSVDPSGKLVVESTPNQDSPLMHGNKPILGCDVWEHAYYLHYQNRRPDYMAAFFNVINWKAVAERYAAT